MGWQTPRAVLEELSRAHSPKHRKCEALKGKPPEQIRCLAQHYYDRARHAEERAERARSALREAVAEIDRLKGLAQAMVEDGE